MKNFKTALAALLAAAALAGLAGCAENAPKDETSNLVLGGNTDDVSDSGGAGGRAEGGSVKLQYAPIALTDNNTVNSIRLFDAISADKDNAMFSPISLNMALGLIEAGAEGETKAALDSYLRTENFSDFAQNYMRLAREKYSLNSDNGKEKNVLEIANSMWADNSLPLKDEYKRVMTEKFEAEIQNLDFADKAKTLGAINGWVNEKTHKLIPSVLDDYGDDIKSVLVNTVYFESAWSDEWRIDEKRKEKFTLPDGTFKELPLMYNGGSAYFENGKACAFSCRYKNGLEFIGILPNDSGEFTLEGLDIPALLESRSYEYRVSAVMPRLNFETAFPLKDALTAAGLENIFDPEKADFSGISESDEYMWVDDILQKTKLELDEKKTKAAAATVIVAPTAAQSVERERRTVRLDRAFAFMIYDPDERQILFVGKVTNP